MNFAESLPERRNLNLMSMVVFVFILGDAHFEGGHAKLMLLNVQFNNLKALTVLAIVLLLWFLFRYFVVVYERFIEDLIKDIEDMNATEIYIICEASGIFPRGIVEAEKEYSLKYTEKKFVYTWNFNDTIFDTKNKKCLYLNIAKKLLRQSVVKPTLSTYLAPMIFALLAVVLLIWHII